MLDAMRRIGLARAGGVVALAAGLVLALRPAPAVAGTQGLWRDSNGKYWCGGECSAGQSCCSIIVRPPVSTD
jgi:hypothetical protein